MNARKKRRRDLECWREERDNKLAALALPSPSDLRRAALCFCGAVQAAKEFAQALAQTITIAVNNLSPAIAPTLATLAASIEPQEMAQEITLPELREMAGDGATGPRVRFTGEGGFSVN